MTAVIFITGNMRARAAQIAEEIEKGRGVLCILKHRKVVKTKKCKRRLKFRAVVLSNRIFICRGKAYSVARFIYLVLKNAH